MYYTEIFLNGIHHRTINLKNKDFKHFLTGRIGWHNSPNPKTILSANAHFYGNKRLIGSVTLHRTPTGWTGTTSFHDSNDLVTLVATVSNDIHGNSRMAMTAELARKRVEQKSAEPKQLSLFDKSKKTNKSGPQL